MALCSECARPLDPIVAIDIDGTLGDYHGHFIEFAEGWLGQSLPAATDYNGRLKFWQYLGLDLETYRTVKLAYRQGGIKRTMPLFPRVSDLMNDLHYSGAEIWICTTRPYLRLDNIDPDTRNWLDRNDIKYDHMIYGDDKYDQLKTLADDSGRDVVGVLDDLPEQVAMARENGLQPLLVKAPHNEFAPGERMDRSEAFALLVDRVGRWYRHAEQERLNG